LKSVLKIMDKIFEVLTITSIISMISVVLIQVLARFLLPKAPSWTEEIARFFFVTGVAFGSPLAMKYKEFVRVDVIINKLSGKIAIIVEMISNIVISIFIFIVAFYAIDFVELGSIQRASTINVPMSLPFASILVALIFIGIYSVLNLVNDFQKLKKGDIR